MTATEHELSPTRVPAATYRIQFGPALTLRDALGIVPYLHALGVSDLYASPLFAARSGSTHGYDVADYGRVSPALGGDEALDALTAALRERGMGMVLDMVPNHMGVGPDNPWWMDVLENGQSSPYASFFDIEWSPVKPELAGKVLLPILGDQYGVTLESGNLKIEYEDGALSIRHYDYRLPVAPRTYVQVLTVALEDVVAALPEGDPDRQEFESIITAIGYLPSRDEQDPERLAERRREKEVVKRRLANLCAASPSVRVALDAAILALNGSPGDPRSFDRLHDLIDAQPYRLAFWRVAAEEINYRRFFDINDLAAVRVELPEVFEATHDLALRLLADGRASGLRIDHPDGLWDPPGYFRQVQERFAAARGEGRKTKDEGLSVESGASAAHATSPSPATDTPSSNPLYVVAEKILSEREPLPEDWAVAGTTGYDFLNAANGLFVDPRGEKVLDAAYRRFISPEDPAAVPPFHEQEYRAKHLIMETSLASEINALAHRLERINEKNRRYRDFTLQGMTGALIEVLACLSVYRTYITGPETVAERDRRFVQQAVAAARRRSPRTPRSLFGFIEDTLLLRNLDEFRPDDRGDVVDLVMRFQQISGPVMAKSVEDTAFYGYHRLIALNEVGGSPDVFGISPEAFHRQNAERARRWPQAMLSSSTHDTKRSEDVRARIDVLSEVPYEWETAVARWTEIARAHKTDAEGELIPDRNDEYLFYQTVVGAWEEASLPTFRERIAAYMEKATKEAKIHTSWINPNETYDAAVREFVAGALADGSPLLAEMAPLARRAAFFGRFNSLAQTLLKLTSPGVPDTYQGTELWDLSLVDPDNRRPVDFALRERLLAELRARAEAAREALAAELLEHCADGRIKLYLTAEALGFRRRSPSLFADGDYRPLAAAGPKAEHAVAFARAHGGAELVAVAPRLVAGLAEGREVPPVGGAWGATSLTLPMGRFRDLLTGRELAGGERSVSEILAVLPVALLEREA